MVILKNNKHSLQQYKKCKEYDSVTTYKIKFINNVGFMAISLSTLVGRFTEGLHKDKCRDCMSNPEYVMAKDSALTFKFMECNKSYDKKFNKDLIKRSQITYRYCDRDIATYYDNEFYLMLR